MRLVIAIFTLLLASCATRSSGCPDVPSMGDQETLKDYTVHIISMYKECQKIKIDKTGT